MSLAHPLHPGTAAAPLARIPNMTAIASGKGGVGKTWFAITLASVLASVGQKILLFDADLGLANAHIQLGFLPDKDLGSVVAGRMPMAEVVARVPDGGFDLLAGRSGSGSLANMPVNRLAGLRAELAGLARNYDQVLLDLGAGVDRNTRAIGAQASRFLIVTTDEPTALTDAYAFIKVTHKNDAAADIRVVINMATSAREAETTYQTLLKACQGFLRYEPPIAGMIRRDKRVRESIRAQTPTAAKYPNTKAVGDVKRIAAGLLKG